MTDPGPLGFVVAVLLAALIAMAVFAHASKHGSRHATAWGAATFLAAGITVPVYFIRFWLRRRTTRTDQHDEPDDPPTS